MQEQNPQHKQISRTVKENSKHKLCFIVYIINKLVLFFRDSILCRPITEAARSKVWVCGRSLAGTAGSNPAGGMDVCLL
jgi:hypothetical protein